MISFKEYLDIEISEGLGIGDLVKLKKPIRGFDYALINGFKMDKSATLDLGARGNGPVLPRGKVSELIVTLKISPLSTSNDTDNKKTNIEFDSFTKVDNEYSEIQKWKSEQKNSEMYQRILRGR